MSKARYIGLCLICSLFIIACVGLGLAQVFSKNQDSAPGDTSNQNGGKKEADEKNARKDRPRSVLIVKEGLHSAKGVGKFSAISIVNRKTIETLEGFFPNYQNFPSSEFAGHWKAGYRVYFNFPRGHTICITLSGNDDGQTWTIGKGEFSTKGDFQAFLKTLETPE